MCGTLDLVLLSWRQHHAVYGSDNWCHAGGTASQRQHILELRAELHSGVDLLHLQRRAGVARLAAVAATDQSCF
jgi:hypothetical protein